MNDTSTDGSLFSLRSMFPSLSSSTNMQQSDEQTKELPQPTSTQNRLAPSQESSDKLFRRFHYHSISDSSAFGSNDSSPTTTISTVDDSSATEPSPGSSPESPPPNTFAVGMHRPRTADDSRPFFELQKQLPPKKGRNLKNLAVNTSRNTSRGASSASLPLPKTNTITDDLPSETAPTFVKPHTPSKRKPGNLGLTLLTANSGKSSLQEIRLAIPPTPAFGQSSALRPFQSSPSLPLAPGFPSEDDRPRLNRVRTTLETILSPVESDTDSFDAEEERNYDVPLSQEGKLEAYPEGPICVFEPYIDLYLEPTVEEAQEYDVIMNVASEVRNPFAEHDEPITNQSDIRIDGGGGIQYAPKRDRTSQKRSSTEITHDASPTTPKATPLDGEFSSDDTTPRARKEPEYIHVKWEHNSDIVPDLLRLVKLIDEKVMQDKRVLIHCQCGVSRSASLVVAYGLYKDPTLSVQQAYDEVKSRSKWIGPNMNLIMQLQEFRTSLMHGGLLPSNRGMTPITPASALREWRGPSPLNHTSLDSSRIIGGPDSIRTQTAEALPVVISGPSSAPNDTTRPPADQTTGQRARAASAVKPGAAYVNPSGRVVPAVPILKVMEPETQSAKPTLDDSTFKEQDRKDSRGNPPIESRKASTAEEEFAMTPLQPSPDVDPADSFGLMSPSTTEFSSSPFDRSALLARLGMGSVGRSVGQEDSPPRRSASLRTRKTTLPEEDQRLSSEPRQTGRLRLKISSPNIREQQQLQSLQSNIEASQRSADSATFDAEAALMSPRATEFTQNPFALSLSIPSSPASSESPKSSDSDPRSPAHKGVSPITRNILDVL